MHFPTKLPDHHLPLTLPRWCHDPQSQEVQPEKEIMAKPGASGQEFLGE